MKTDNIVNSLENFYPNSIQYNPHGTMQYQKFSFVEMSSSESNETKTSEESEKFNHDAQFFFENFNKNFIDSNIELSIRVISAMTNDPILCQYISESTFCRSVILNSFYYKNFYQWPLNLNNEIRGYSEKAIENLETRLNNDLHIKPIACLYLCPKIRRQLSLLIGLSTIQMTIQSEVLLNETLKKIHEFFNQLKVCGTPHLFFLGPAHCLIEILYVVKEYLSYHQVLNRTYLGPCPLLIIKLAFDTFKLFESNLSLNSESADFSSCDLFPLVFPTLKFFCSFDSLSSHSCNCMTTKHSGSSIPDERDIVSIIIFSCKSVLCFYSILESQTIQNPSFKHQEIIDTLFQSVLSSTISDPQLRDSLIFNIYSSILKIFSHLLNFHKIDELSEDIYKINNSKILSFLVKTSTIQFSQKTALDENHTLLLSNISKISLEILNIILPSIKFKTSDVLLLNDAKIMQRISILLKIEDPEFLKILLETISRLSMIGLKKLLRTKLGGDLEKLRTTSLKETVDSLLYELNNDNLDISIFMNKENEQVSSTPLRSIPWLVDYNSPKKPIFELKGAPVDDLSPFFDDKLDKKFKFSIRDPEDKSNNLNKSSFSDPSLTATNQTEIHPYRYNDEKMKKLSKKKFLSKENLHQSLGNEKSLLRRIKSTRKGSNDDIKTSNKIINYVSNMFRSKRKLNRP